MTIDEVPQGAVRLCSHIAENIELSCDGIVRYRRNIGKLDLVDQNLVSPTHIDRTKSVQEPIIAELHTYNNRG